MCELHSLPRAPLAFGDYFTLLKKKKSYSCTIQSLCHYLLHDNIYHPLMAELSESLKPKDWSKEYYLFVFFFKKQSNPAELL